MAPTELVSDELKALKIKRGHIKAKITNFTKYLDSFVATAQNINQLKTRLTLFEPAWNEFEDIQSKIEALDQPDDSSSERFNFENDFCTVVGNAKTIIESVVLPIASNSASLSMSSNPTPTNNSQRVKLPVLSLPKFSGSYDEWLSFRDRFNSSINHDDSLADVDKFQYLLSSLSGEAYDTIKFLTVCENNYPIAWKKLQDRYEDKRLLVQSHITALFNFSSINKNSAASIKRILDTVGTNLQCLESLGVDTSSWDLILIHFVRQKFDQETLQKWESLDFSDLPTWSDLIKFLTKLYKTLEATSDVNKPHTFKSSSHNVQPNFQKHNSNNKFLNNSQRKPLTCNLTTYHSKCGICNSNHMLHQCPKFLALGVEARYNKITQLKLCKNCLKANHNTSNCQSTYLCRQCRKRHHTLLHFDNLSSISNIASTATNEVANYPVVNNNNGETTCTNTQALLTSLLSNNLHDNYQVSSQVLLSTVLIHVFDKYNNAHPCRAVLDVGSQTNMITENFFNKLNLNYSNSNSSITGINQSTIGLLRSTTINLKSRNNSYSKTIKCLILPKITSHLPTFSFNSSHLKIPKNLILADPNFNTSSEIDLLLGAEIFWELLCVGQFQLGRNLPFLQKTHFGWIVGGSIANCKQNAPTDTYSTCLLSLDQQLTKFWEIEEHQTVKNNLSPSELECENHFINNHFRDSTGKFVVSLPFIPTIKPLGLSKPLALKRFNSLEKRLRANHELYTDYKNFMSEYLELNHMELVPEPIASELSKCTEAYFLPHHAVVKASSTTTKTRVVFDGSAKTPTGVSLNDNLLVGPTIQQELFSILLRFRTYRYALTADIEKMYRQVNINESDTHYQLILWRDNPDKNIETYKLKTVTYGTTSAPFLAIRCLFQLADDEGEPFPTAREIIKRDFYVDDLLTGANSLEEALKLRNDITFILGKGNFNLRKWASNDPNLLPKYNEDNLGNSVNATINIDKMGETKTLGLFWNCQCDLLSYSLVLPKTNTKITKRTILSTVAQIFDPLGLIGPVIIIAKLILQRLWSLKIHWDESVPLNLHTQWLNYVQSISHINKIKIARNTIIDQPRTIELHGFCDASESAYGMCIYLKSIDRSNSSRVNLLCAKSRVAPLKTISLPRLELCGAVLLNKFMQKVLNSLSNIKVDEVFYWTDSTIVLSWLSDSPSRWKTFVANRVTEIQNSTTITQWRHVTSQNNPADIISRGATPENLFQNKLWWNGPEFLHNTVDNYPFTPEIQKNLIVDLRQTKSVLLATIENDLELGNETSEKTHCEINPLNSVFERYSSFSHLTRVVAYCLRWYRVYKTNKSKDGSASKYNTGNLFREELTEANNVIIKIIQQTHFSKEYNHLCKKGEVPNNNKLLGLRPFLDSNGIIRVGGRLRNANLHYDSKHQILLPKEHFVTKLIILEIHTNNLHIGPLSTLNLLRHKYWVLSGRSVIRKILHSCITCFRAHPTSNQQLMGDLPSARVLPTRPFIRCGVDYAGPIYIKGPGRSKIKVKSYIAVFVCLSTKAIHIELVCGLSTESFLSAFRRFIARRGYVSDIYSDNGTTFVGANKELIELRELFLSNTFKEVIQSLAAKNINWHFIPSSAPNFGGIWEAGVKSIKYHLRRTTNKAYLTYDELYTLLTQIEACLNSRPITPLSNDPNDLEPLTPAHFLIGDSLITPLEPDLRSLNENRLSRWQRIQQLTQHFWKRWSTEYLSNLQQRTKWRKIHDNNVSPGTVVVLKEDNLPPLHWRLGRISAVYPGADGLVRVVKVQTKAGEVKRPISKICMLPYEDNITNL